MAVIRTIENDPASMHTAHAARTPPFGAPDVPPAEWVYRRFLAEWATRGATAVHIGLEVAAERAAVTYGHPVTFRDLPRFPARPSRDRTVDAYVNHGRWVWDCPCGSAQVASATDLRGFCVGCFNGGDGWWPIIYPVEVDQVVELLARRADPESRNWRPGEPVDQLQLENLSLGIDPDLPGLPWHGATAALALVRDHRALVAARQHELEGG